MASSSPSLSIDLGRFLTEVGSSLYKNGGVILDELVQNAQRAGSPTLAVRLRYATEPGAIGVLEVSDTGCGLKDPNDLLRAARSGWSAKVKATDKPFGLGFMSVFIATSRVEVLSNGIRLVLDSDKLHRTRSVRGVVTTEPTSDGPCPGFLVRLYSPPRPGKEDEEQETEAQRRWTAWKELTRAVDGLPELVRFMDFERVESTVAYPYGDAATTHEAALSALEDDCRWRAPTLCPTRAALDVAPAGVPFAVRVESPLYVGVLWPQTSSWSPEDNAPWAGLRFYAQRRVVRAETYQSYGGWLHLKPGAVNLRAPDRKDFCEDALYEKLMDIVKAEVRALFRALAVSATDEELRRYDNSLRYVLTDEDVLGLLPLLFPPDAAAEGRAEGGATQSEARGGEMPPSMPREVHPSAETVTTDVAMQGAALVVGAETAPSAAPFVARRRRSAVALPLPAAWVEADGLIKHSDALELARDAGMAVLVANTAMQGRALRLAEKVEPRLVHLAGISGRVVVDALAEVPEFTGPGAQVVLRALNLLARAVGAERVRVGDLSFRRHLTLGETKLPLPVQGGAVLLGLNYDGTIYVDASLARGVAREAAAKTSPLRYAALRLCSVVAHERAHQLTPAPDGTAEHLAMIEKVMHTAHDYLAENL